MAGRGMTPDNSAPAMLEKGASISTASRCLGVMVRSATLLQYMGKYALSGYFVLNMN
jgi:hypothetical protein